LTGCIREVDSGKQGLKESGILIRVREKHIEGNQLTQPSHHAKLTCQSLRQTDENHLATWDGTEENHLENHGENTGQQNNEEEFVPVI
jgi:hypothetical protein